jgi:hypothetical protein
VEKNQGLTLFLPMKIAYQRYDTPCVVPAGFTAVGALCVLLPF